jgi:hypothetical protein
MVIYQANHPGQHLVGAENQRRLRQEDQFSGFFSRAALERILEPALCVGIRFYNAGGASPNDRQLVAIGVLNDGSELSRGSGGGYFLSAADASEVKITKAQAKNLAAIRRRPGVSVVPMFTSFFSRTMINLLLAPADSEGVRFYRSLVEGSNFNTHLGVSATADRAALETSSSHIVCDLPCPGRCATIAANEFESGQSLSAPLRHMSLTELDSTKYLVVWSGE